MTRNQIRAEATGGGRGQRREKPLPGAPLVLAFWLLFCMGEALSREVRLPRVGIPVLHFRADNTSAWQSFNQRFVETLKARGWEPGRTILLDYRTPKAALGDVSASVRELVDHGADVIYAPAAPLLRASYASAPKVPIVALDYTTDPVRSGYALSYARPGKNVTGVFLDAPDISGKWIEILRTVIPRMSRVDVLWDPSAGDTHRRTIAEVCRRMGIKAVVHVVRDVAEIEAVFASPQRRAKAMVILPSPLLVDYSPVIARQALQHKVLTISPFRTFVDVGGALAYGPNQAEMIERSVDLLIRILNGARPGDMPIERPTRFDFFFNPATFRALNLDVSETLALSATPTSP